ncbi:MAG: metallophosphoesterase [Paludibacter sp.]|nr:metallophosphoesterase [Paludibacter sp.]
MKINILSFCISFAVLLIYTQSCKQAEVSAPAPLSDTTQIAQLVFTADLHYGLKRAFRGNVVNSNGVNEAMVAQMNTLPKAVFPADGGVNAGRTINFIDYVAINGDITNRQESGIQSATASWAQFSADYLNGGITLKNKRNQPAEFLLTCGNHDVANAIGYPKALSPATDNAAMVNIYNLMLKPATPKTATTYNYSTDKPNFSKDMVGVHLMFITMWPDSAARVWMERDLGKVGLTTPVLIFTHDPIGGEPTHFTNPFGNHEMATDYENEIEEQFKGMLPLQRELAAFLKIHPNIKAYFHGHTNYNEYYTFVGPDGDLNLKVFRVDSPMKGEVSGSDDSQLSFQVLSIDGKSKTLTVRECLWNSAGAASSIKWGTSSTVSLTVL